MPTLTATDYTPYYCEENIWRLCRRALDAGIEADALIISNPARQCLLWHQRAAEDPRYPVCWDYHVVMIAHATAATPAQVWDLDTTLGAPIPFALWWRGTFPFTERLDPEHHPWFRVFCAADYLATLSSDRQHMRRDGAWLATPPPWPLIHPDAPANLMQLIDVQADGPGEVMGWEAVVGRYGQTPTPALTGTPCPFKKG